jgi:hypothetical protein
VSDPLEDYRHVRLMFNHWNDANELSDKLITRVLLHSIVVSMSLSTSLLKISFILNPKRTQLR